MTWVKRRVQATINKIKEKRVRRKKNQLERKKMIERARDGVSIATMVRILANFAQKHSSSREFVVQRERTQLVGRLIGKNLADRLGITDPTKRMKLVRLVAEKHARSEDLHAHNRALAGDPQRESIDRQIVKLLGVQNRLKFNRAMTDSTTLIIHQINVARAIIEKW
jgi:hypothetical protein